MKTLSVVTASVLAVGFLFVTGCYVERRTVYAPPPPVVAGPATEIIVDGPPPPSRTEVIVASPGPAYVWVPGCWEWRGHWMWVGGRWAPRPHPHAVWVAPRYVVRGHSHVWIHGHWR